MSEQHPGEARTLLACFAHPDDETFTAGATLARYANEQVRVVLVSATLGESGVTGGLASREDLPRLREEELRCAARRLGVSDLILLGYRDSGMQGSQDNQDPRTLIRADDEQVVRQLVAIIRRERPLVVMTFEPGGGYGHPDHKAISAYTTRAFHAAADEQRYPEQGQPWQPERLFYTSLTRSFFRNLRERLEARGLDSSEVQQHEQDSWPDEQVNVLLDVTQDVEAKWAAFHCHRSQIETMRFFFSLPDHEMKELLRLEYFRLVVPILEEGRRLDDLFAPLES